jgi:hypothetical protein
MIKPSLGELIQGHHVFANMERQRFEIISDKTGVLLGWSDFPQYVGQGDAITIPNIVLTSS